MSLRVEPLDPARHDRGNFDCGRPELNEWLAKSAGQAQRRQGSARTFVLTADGAEIIGYYALASHSVDTSDVSERLARGQLRHFPIPAVLLARLAIASTHQGHDLGRRLLADAVRRVLAASESIGIALLVVHAADEQAAGFYERYGFERWPSSGLRLFARIKDIAITFRA